MVQFRPRLSSALANDSRDSSITGVSAIAAAAPTCKLLPEFFWANHQTTGYPPTRKHFDQGDGSQFSAARPYSKKSNSQVGLSLADCCEVYEELV